jgi:hypothetical protein
MLLALLAILLKVLLPPALLRPSWQLAVADALRGGASVALVGAVLLLLAERPDPDGEGLLWLVTWVRRLAIAAAMKPACGSSVASACTSCWCWMG